MRGGKVLVLGNENSSFLTVVRSLGRRGIIVHVGMCGSGLAATRSRYISKIHHIEMTSEARSFDIERFCSLLDQERYDLVMPCDDPCNITLDAHRTRLNRYGNIYILEKETYDITSNKFEINKICRVLGINLPRERLVTVNDNPERIYSDFGPFVVLKPLSSFHSGNLDERRGVRKAYSYETFVHILTEMLKSGDVLVQEDFLGTGIGVECLAKGGKVLTAFQHQRVHEPLHGGGSSYRKSVPLDTRLLEAAQKLLGYLKYTGVAMLEFKKNYESGDWTFIEINARFWGSLPLPVAAGIDFPYYLYEMLVKGKEEFNRVYRTNLYCRNLTQDVDWMIANIKADKHDVRLNTKPVYACVLEVANIIMLRERSDTLRYDDPIPGCIEMYQVLRSVLQRVITIVYLGLSDMLLSRKAIKRLVTSKIKHSKRILFVCKGNICRSPFAEMYAAKSGHGCLDILSAGTIQKQGRVSPYEAMEAAWEYGIDLSRHASKPLTNEIIRRSDVIVIFDKENCAYVVRNHASALHKTVLLGIYSDCPSTQIADPFGKDKQEFLRTYCLIAKCIDRITGKSDANHSGCVDP
ncbi:MAG: ATP-grasp domain-containing protein [Syntrophobacteraceae bacterium]|jgi:protein-tyrosine-phosphatase/predicted ATP-grasp superfamily ATP-dependent carboligase